MPEQGTPGGADYEYFYVEKQLLQPGRKTHVYRCISQSNGALLAVIKWHGAWRQFCFFPTEGSLWSFGCLADVVDFLERLRKERADA